MGEEGGGGGPTRGGGGGHERKKEGKDGKWEEKRGEEGKSRIK